MKCRYFVIVLEQNFQESALYLNICFFNNFSAPTFEQMFLYFLLPACSKQTCYLGLYAFNGNYKLLYFAVLFTAFPT